MSPHSTGVRTPIEADVLIIGAGPTGLYGAYYGGFRGLRVAVADTLPEPGGQISAMYPEKLIYDIAGFPEVRGRELVERLLEQCAPFDPHYLLGMQARRLTVEPDGTLEVWGSDDRVVRCRAVVITGGIGSFEPRPLPVGGEYEGRGLAYFVPQPAEYAGREVVIVGGGDSAFDWAQTLEPLARSVTLVHRRDRFRAHEHTVRSVLDSSVQVLTNAQVTAVNGSDWVASVEVTRAGSAVTVPAQRVIAALGFVADLGPLEHWGLEVSDRGIMVDSTMATTVPGVFAAGDIARYRGKIKLISVGFGEVATAINHAAALVDPSAPVFPGHSTNA